LLQSLTDLLHLPASAKNSADTLKAPVKAGRESRMQEPHRRAYNCPGKNASGRTCAENGAPLRKDAPISPWGTDRSGAPVIHDIPVV
jgi:hypothetical protein